MAKAAKADQTKAAAKPKAAPETKKPEPPKKAAEPPKEKESKNAKKKRKEAANESRLSKFRPKRRLIFFVTFTSLCVWLSAFDDHCDVKGQRRDCGWPGISTGLCRLGACFIKGGGSMAKKTIKVKRNKGATLGLLASADDESGGWALVKSVEDSGAVEEYNRALDPDSEERILPGDSLAKVDGKTGTGILKALAATDDKTVEIELRKTPLPSYLKWIRMSPKPHFLEKILTAPGFVRFAGIWSRLGGAGFFCWFLSGYPVASLPMYMVLSGGVAFNSVRCCYEVSSGAHCYKGEARKIENLFAKAAEGSTALVQRVSADPKGYAEWLFVPPLPWK